MQQDTSWPGRVRLAGPWSRRRPARGADRHPERMGRPASAALVAAALIVAACGSSPTGPGGAPGVPPSAGAGGASPGTTVKAATINGVTVLINAKGFTVYSFAPDTPTTSRCNGQCAKYWPPVKGPVTAGAGVPGTLGTITRSDGFTQATYDGHPLHTYVADTAPGQAKGNGLNLSGGVWHEVTTSGAAAPSPSSGGSASSGGGYGY
jgi:predicted lipoprotein with Yx(FWY)xxD motif